MTKIVKSKSKSLRSIRKKPQKRTVTAKRAAPKRQQSRSRQLDTTETRADQPDQHTAGTEKRARTAGAEHVTHRFPRPFLLPFAVMDMWFRAVEPARDSK